MITKERLLAGLNEVIFVEEGMVTLFANFSKAMVEHVEGIDEDKKREIIKLLSRLNRDSSRHKEMIDKIIIEVGASTKDEY